MKAVAKQSERGLFKAQIVEPGAGKGGKDKVLFMAPRSVKTQKEALADANQLVNAANQVVDLRNDLEAANKSAEAAHAECARRQNRLDEMREELTANNGALETSNNRVAELEAELGRARDVIAAKDDTEAANDALRRENEALTKRATAAEDSIPGYKWALGATIVMALTIIVIVVDTTVGFDAILK